MHSTGHSTDLTKARQGAPAEAERRTATPLDTKPMARVAPQSKGHSGENQLLQVRLGVASSLFTALRHKHADTSSHSLRVTLQTAAWCLSLGMSDEQRDVMEVASLLHDVGKIGVPDSILMKPGPLTREEMHIMDQHRQMGVEILRSSCASQDVLNVLSCSAAWYDGSNPRIPIAGQDIPLGARMLAICDAFDAMTSDQVYRRALSNERAMNELFRCAGHQFDPELVKMFAQLREHDQGALHEQVARRWLRSLSPESNGMWQLNTAPAGRAELIPEAVFRERLFENLRDAIIFVDASRRILSWNPGAERMTGIAATSIYQHRFVPSLLEMRDPDGFVVLDEECAVADAMDSMGQRLKRFIIRGRGQKDLSVEAHIVPVAAKDGSVHGAAIHLHDVSPELSLEARCQSLHEMATQDPLTRVANRAEFNRVHQMFVEAHLERNLPCSLIITDIDRFKTVNDTYGHQAGDEVLKTFAVVLKNSCRPGDLVARYGGEEFVLLCADCNNAVAARRADAIRKSFAQLPHQALGGRCSTASFGVTEIQAGDTPDSMLARADRALYEAKENGRNRVVQLGTGLSGTEQPRFVSAGGNAVKGLVAEQHLVSPVPLSIAIEKLRGFVADHKAEIIKVDGGDVRMKLGDAGGFMRRSSDRNVPLFVDVHLEEQAVRDAAPAAVAKDVGKKPAKQPPPPSGKVTKIRVAVTLQRLRDRRRGDATERAGKTLASLRSYLMASEDGLDEPLDVEPDGKNKGGFWPWNKKPPGPAVSA